MDVTNSDYRDSAFRTLSYVEAGWHLVGATQERIEVVAPHISNELWTRVVACSVVAECVLSDLDVLFDACPRMVALRLELIKMYVAMDGGKGDEVVQLSLWALKWRSPRRENLNLSLWMCRFG